MQRAMRLALVVVLCLATTTEAFVPASTTSSSCSTMTPLQQQPCTIRRQQPIALFVIDEGSKSTASKSSKRQYLQTRYRRPRSIALPPLEDHHIIDDDVEAEQQTLNHLIIPESTNANHKISTHTEAVQVNGDSQAASKTSVEKQKKQVVEKALVKTQVVNSQTKR